MHGKKIAAKYIVFRQTSGTFSIFTMISYFSDEKNVFRIEFCAISAHFARIERFTDTLRDDTNNVRNLCFGWCKSAQLFQISKNYAHSCRTTISTGFDIDKNETSKDWVKILPSPDPHLGKKHSYVQLPKSASC